MSSSDTHDLASAREHFEQGLGYYRGEFYLDALQEFIAARQLAPTLPGIDFYLEVCTRKVNEVTGQLASFMESQFDRETHERAESLRIAEAPSFIAEISRLLTQEKLQEAIQRIAEAETTVPDSLPLLLLKGNVLRRCGRLAEAETTLRRAVTLNPGSAQVHNNLGNVLSARGQLVAAAACIERARELEPKNPRILNNLAVLCMQGNQLDRALGLFDDLLRDHPRFAVATKNKEKLLIRRRELDNEIANLRSEVQRHPTWPDLRVNLGKALLFRGHFAEAREQLKEALSVNQDLLAAWFYLGMLHELEGNLIEALYHFQELVARKGKAATPDFHAYQAFRREGYLEEALAEIKKVAVLELDLAAGQINIGNSHFNQARWAEAEKHYQAAIELNGNYPDAYHRLALALMQQDKQSAARKALTEAIKLNPGFASAHYHLGMLLRTAQPGKAAEHLQRALGLGLRDEFHEMAKTALAGLTAGAGSAATKSKPTTGCRDSGKTGTRRVAAHPKKSAVSKSKPARPAPKK